MSASDAVADFSYFFDVGSDVLSTDLDATTGTLTAQLGDVAKGHADSNEAEVWQQAGLASRPAAPVAGVSACQAIVVKRSDHDICIAMRDTRANAIYGNLEAGATCVYSTSGQARLVCKADGSVRSMTTDDNTPTGNTIQAGISPTYFGIDGNKHLGGEWRYSAPWGSQVHNQEGYHFRHWTGAKVDVTGLGFPAPFSALSSVYSMSADVIRVNGAIVKLGNSPKQDALVQATALQVIATLVATALTAMETMVALLQGPGGPGSGPLNVSSGSAFTTSQGALATVIPIAVGALASLQETCATTSTTAG